jgi:hypothetical protein
MNTKNWLDEEIKDDIYYEVSEIAPEFRKQKLEEKKQKHVHEEIKQKFRNDLFRLFKWLVILMFGTSYIFMGCTLIHPSTSSVIISVTALMAPLILTLAMMRFLFANKEENSNKNIPSIAINFIKEIREVVVAYLKAKDKN